MIRGFATTAPDTKMVGKCASQPPFSSSSASPSPPPPPPQEFARILTCDDITKFKKAGAEEEGLVDKSEAQWYNKEKGLTFKEMKMAQTKMRDMLHDRGERWPASPKSPPLPV